VVKTIFTSPGHNLDHPKEKVIDLGCFSNSVPGPELNDDVLIVGQPVFMRERLTPKKVAAIDSRIIAG
jgi:hypothetical protein